MRQRIKFSGIVAGESQRLGLGTWVLVFVILLATLVLNLAALVLLRA